MDKCLLRTALICALSAVCLSTASQAAHFTTTTTQGAATANWGLQTIWEPGGVAPTAGNTYEALDNGTAFGASQGNTRLRNLTTAGVQAPFPGDSLTLGTNTEFRFKTGGSIITFPGVNGNAGLILKGGVLNTGDDATYELRGKIEVASTSYLFPADNGGGILKPLRGFIISAQLTGKGTMILAQGATNIPQIISGTQNTFSGDWIIIAGLLRGTGLGSLGTGSITVDPLLKNDLIFPQFPTVIDLELPAILEVTYDHVSPGKLTLVNGGMMNLHQNCTFAAVTVEGTALTAGIHPYSELAKSFPANFPPGGSGSITVGTVAKKFTAKVVQAAGQNWNGTIWEPGLVAPVAGSTYELISNGTNFGNALNNTRIRNPATAGIQTFPGDSLTLNANTEIRAKQAGAILNFPGVGGKPGLILNGGILNAGDDAVFTITGNLQVASTSYIVQGDNGGGAVLPLRGFNISGQLSGSGSLVIYQAGTNVAQELSGTQNTFTGDILVKAGWLKGSGNNSLGTGNIVIDPKASVSTDASVTLQEGPAWLEVGYDINSPGKLTLQNGGRMILHQNATFDRVTIEGKVLDKGTYTYASLAATYPNNFAAGGSGSLTVKTGVANFTTITTQGAATADWTGQTIWQPGGVAPTAGNTYEALDNGTAFGAGRNNTRIRNLTTAGLQIPFPGDSLTLNTNTEFRFKTVGAIINFPGVNGKPGLILKGGNLNAGDDTVFVITGRIQVASTSFIVPADVGAGNVTPLRGINLAGQLSGSGALVIYQAGTQVAQEISGNQNTYTGDIFLKAGWLRGSGTNSLGTGNITIDPLLPVDVDPSATPVEGPAQFEVMYDIASPGKLTLLNGGMMILHQKATFSAVNIEGTLLSKGVHPASELLASFPSNFDPTSTGSITVGAAAAAPVFNKPALSGTTLTLSWTGSGKLQEATAVTGPWTDVAGNPQGSFTAQATAAPRKFYRLVP